MLDSKHEKLVNVLRELIKKYANNTKVKNILCEEFDNRNILASKASNILTGKIKLEELIADKESDLFILFVFTLGLQKALSSIDEITEDTLGTLEEYSKLVVANYFTELEVNNFIDTKLEQKEVSKYPYIFHNMIQVQDKHWMGLCSAINLASIDASNDFTYNYATQRDPKIDVFGFKEINIDYKKIDTIEFRLLKGLQKPDEIKLNVLRGTGDGDYQNYEVEFVPYSKDGIIGDLIIHSGEIDIFDGYHRKTANSKAVKENPVLDFYWKIAITNWSEKSAQDYMVQINEQRPIKREHVKNMNSNILGNLIVDEIKDSRSEFGTQIKESDAELQSEGLTKKSILSMAIEDCYGEYLKNRILIKPIGNWIAEFMDYIIGLYVDEFVIKIQDTKKHSFINNKNMFYGYIALSEKLYKQDNWQAQIKEKMKSIDFNITNQYWKDIMFSNDELSKKTKKDLYSFFRRSV